VDAANKTRLPRQRPSGDRKTNFRLVIYSRNSTNREDGFQVLSDKTASVYFS